MERPAGGSRLSVEAAQDHPAIATRSMPYASAWRTSLISQRGMPPGRCWMARWSQLGPGCERKFTAGRVLLAEAEKAATLVGLPRDDVCLTIPKPLDQLVG